MFADKETGSLVVTVGIVLLCCIIAVWGTIKLCDQLAQEIDATATIGGK